MPWAEPATPPAEPFEAEVRRRLSQIEQALTVLLDAVEIVETRDAEGLVTRHAVMRARHAAPHIIASVPSR